MAMAGRAAQQQFPNQDAGYKAEFEELEEKGATESLLCTEELVPDENLMNEVGAKSSLGSMDHTAMLGDPSGKILKKEGSPEVSKEEEEVDGEYYLDRKPESHLAPLMSLDSHPLAFYQPSHPAACFGDVNADPPISETEPSQELVLPSKSEEKVDSGGLHVTKMEATKKKKRVLVRGSQNAPCVGLENEQNPDVNQNLSLGHPTRRSARCATATNVGQPSFRLCSVLLSKGNADGIQERVSGLLEISEESVPPARKKTRTFYNAKQLQELEKTFQEDHYPDNEKRREIAALVGVTPQRIMVWFQNRRAKWRKIEKLKGKNNKKCSVAAPAVPVDPQQMPQGQTVLPGAQLSDTANNQPNTVAMDTATVNYSGPPISVSTSSDALVTSSKTSCYDSIQTKANTFQGSLGSLREELFPAIPSPPPIRRTKLPFNVVLNPNHHIVPLMLDDSLPSECSPSSQESSSSDALTYSIQSQSSPVDCNYSEQLEPTTNLEASCFHPNNHPGMHQHSQYSQHEMSHFPIHLSGNTLPSVRLTTATPSKSTTYFSIPGSNGLMTYGAAECSQGFLPNHVGTHLLLQPSAGSSGYLPAFQTLQWNEFSTQGPSFPHSFSSSPIPFSGLATIGGGSAQQAPFAPNQTLPASSCLLQLPKAPGPGATLLFTTKPLVPMNLEPPSQPLPKMLAEEDSDPDNGPQEMESLPDFSEDSKIGLTFSPHQDEKTA